ncbi:hypothetical protein C4564_05695 [Candidatus Microgenomates bacterium]|nr:MAG: hypothetical protein C4564_05695 [Candidatus Microgenomates bacterium]
MNKKIFFTIQILNTLIAFSVAWHIGHQVSRSEVVAVEKNVPEEKHLVFVSNRTGNYDIYKMDLDTKQTVNLTNSPGDDMNPQVSPDGKHIIYYSNKDGADNEIYKVNLDSLETQRLTNNISEDYDPTFSPDGSMIAFKSDRDDGLGDIFIMNTDGTKQINLTISKIETEEWDPVFTNDGQNIIYVSRLGNSHFNDELYSMGLNGDHVKRLTNNSVADWFPNINPVNGSILYTSSDTPDTKDDIFILDPEQNTSSKIVSLPGDDNDQSWSANGERIAFINNQDGDYDIYVYNTLTQNMKLIENTPADELSPVFVNTP